MKPSWHEMNAYVYVKNNPIRYRDSSGKAVVTKGQVWGNYCGDDWCGGGDRDEKDYSGCLNGGSPLAPRDSIDSCCMTHDACRGGWDQITGKKAPAGSSYSCDIAMCNCLSKVDVLDYPEALHEYIYMKNIFCNHPGVF